MQFSHVIYEYRDQKAFVREAKTQNITDLEQSLEKNLGTSPKPPDSRARQLLVICIQNTEHTRMKETLISWLSLIFQRNKKHLRYYDTGFFGYSVYNRSREYLLRRVCVCVLGDSDIQQYYGTSNACRLIGQPTTPVWVPDVIYQ